MKCHQFFTAIHRRASICTKSKRIEEVRREEEHNDRNRVCDGEEIQERTATKMFKSSDRNIEEWKILKNWRRISFEMATE